MRTQLFLGYDRTHNNDMYVIADCVKLKTEVLNRYELGGIIRNIGNGYIDKDRNFIPTDGIIYGVRANNDLECMNTYAIIGHSAGYYIIHNFKTDKIYALTSREIFINKDLFVNKPFINATLNMSLDGVMLNVNCLNNGFVDVFTNGLANADRSVNEDTFRFLKRLIEVRKYTIESGEFKVYKVGKFNMRVLDSNYTEIDKILSDKGRNIRKMLEKYSKTHKKNCGLLESIYMNTSVYNEE